MSASGQIQVQSMSGSFGSRRFYQVGRGAELGTYNPSLASVTCMDVSSSERVAAFGSTDGGTFRAAWLRIKRTQQICISTKRDGYPPFRHEIPSSHRVTSPSQMRNRLRVCLSSMYECKGQGERFEISSVIEHS